MIQTQPINQLELAIKYLNESKLSQAEHCAFKHLESYPSDSAAEKLLGFIYLRANNFNTALKHFKISIENAPNDSEVLNLMGCAYLETGLYEEADRYFNSAIGLNPEYIDAIYNLGLLHFKENDFKSSRESMQKTLSLDPEHINAKKYIALCCIEDKQYAQAENILEILISNTPNRQDLYLSLCKCYIQQKNTQKINDLISAITNGSILFELANYLLETDYKEKTIAIYQSLLSQSKDKSPILNNLASAYDKINQPEKAIELFKEAIKENPEFVGAYSNLGRVLCDLNRMNEAQAILQQAISLSPNHANSYINLARAYNLQNDYEKSIVFCKKALEISPDSAVAYYNIGTSYNYMGKFEKAIEYYNKCLQIDAKYGDAEFNLGMCELTLGRFDSAWGHYFQRYRFLNNDEVLSPIEPGKNYQDKHVYFCYSQGIGDELFFLRFLPQLKQQGAHITYRCSNKLYPILANNAYIDVLLSEVDQTPKCDYYFTIDDIPLVLGMHEQSKIPSPLQIEKPDKHLIEELLQQYSELPRPFIGITWRAGTQPETITYRSNQNRLNKEFSLAQMVNLLKGLKGSVFLLQRNPRNDEIVQLNSQLKQPVIDTSRYNEDLPKMLALLHILDDSICVSNTNLHLLAGINKSTNVIIPYPPEWRWMDIDADSPWFPTIETFRQGKNSKCDVCLLKLKNKLTKSYANS